jgi:hypothetical protein
MTRFPDWPERLAAYIEARRARAFVWGEHDCALFAADWVHEATGRDPAAALRDTYQTAGEAARILHRHGGLARIAGEVLTEWLTPRMAGRGDVALVENAGREALAIVDGAHLIGPGPAGLTFLPLEHALRAWKV